MEDIQIVDLYKVIVGMQSIMLDMKDDIRKIDKKIDNTKAELKEEIASVRTELKADIEEVRTKLYETKEELKLKITEVAEQAGDEINNVCTLVSKDIIPIKDEVKFLIEIAESKGCMMVREESEEYKTE